MHRKEEEKNWYEKRYGSGQSINSSKLRKVVLAASENYFVERMLALAKPGIKVLEIGCGIGEHSFICAMAGASVVGVDISEEAVRIANLRAQEANLGHLLEFKVADVEHLPFNDCSFDLVLDHEVLSSVLLEPVMKECRRVLKKGGVFLGLECLAHNPVFNLNRKIKTAFGTRTGWAVEHILKSGDIENINKLFKTSQNSFFHLVTVFIGPLALFLPSTLARYYIASLNKVDSFLLRKNSLKILAFKTVWELRC